MTRRPLSDPLLHVVRQRLGPAARRFSHSDGANEVLTRENLQVVTGFGPTNAPTAGTLSVMLGAVELQQRLNTHSTVVISELGAWNSRNVPWARLEAVRDQMFAFLRDIGFDERCGSLRSHLDIGNLARAGKIARFLHGQDLHDHREELTELYADHGVLGGDVGVVVDTLYTVADVLEPAEAGSDHVLVVSGLEEAYFTELARLVVERQASAGHLDLGWRCTIGALFFRVLPGFGGYPKMSKSIPRSSVHLGMSADALRKHICSAEPDDHAPLLAAIELASDWTDDQLTAAREAYTMRQQQPAAWRWVQRRYLETFLSFADRWRRAAP